MNLEDTTYLSIEMIRHIATLSRLALTTEEEILCQNELKKFMNLFKSLSEIPVPTHLIHSQSNFLLEDLSDKKLTDTLSRMRDDIPYNSLTTEAFISNVPDKEGVFVRVPTILNPDN